MLFCDNEGEIELLPKEIIASKQEIFSILIKPYKDQLRMYKSSCKLDGISKRYWKNLFIHFVNDMKSIKKIRI